MATQEKVLVASIVDPLLLAGGKTRKEIMEAVRAARPDFKDPSAAVSNAFRRLIQAGKNPSIVQTERSARAVKGRRPPALAAKAVADRIAKVEAWAARMDQEIHQSFVRLAENNAVAHLERRKNPVRAVWPQ